MLTFLPVIMLIISASAVYLLRSHTRGVGYSWLIAVGTSLLLWGGVLAYHWLQPSELMITPWGLLSSQNAESIIFAWDDTGWIYGFCLITLLTAIMITSSIRLKDQSNPVTWASNMMVTAVALPAVLSKSPLAVVFSWTALDLVELFLGYYLSRRSINFLPAILSFAVRGIGTIILITAIVVQSQIGSVSLLHPINPISSLLIVLAIGIRLGVLPINIFHKHEQHLRRGIGTNLHLTLLAVNLAVAARLPAVIAPESWIQILLPMTWFISFFSAIMWISSKSALSGRRFWSAGFAFFALASLLNGNPSASIALGVAAILCGSILLLFSSSGKILFLLPIMAIIQITSIPYTPIAYVWSEITKDLSSNWYYLFILVLGIIIAGAIKHSKKTVNVLSEMDSWVKFIYPSGLTILLISHWIIILNDELLTLSAGVWWAAVLTILSGGLVIIVYRFGLPVINNLGMSNGKGTIYKVLQVRKEVSIFFNLGWFYKLIGAVYNRLLKFIATITLLFEGEGGIVWAIVLLALLVTQVGGGR